MNPYIRLAAALALVAVAAPLAAQEYPKTPPAPGPLTPAPFPPFQEAVLPNGLRILVVESHKQPIVSLSLSFAAGSIFDPPGKEGLSEMVAGLLTKGAGTRTAEQISEAIEGAGGSLSAGAGSDFLTISSTVLKTSLPLAMELVGDAAVRPTFPETEVELLRTQTLSGLQVALSQPEAIASRIFQRTLYGQNPYGRSANPASVKATMRADLVAFQRSRLRPGGALLVVAGATSLAEIRALAMKTFRGWAGVPPAAPIFKAPPVRTRTELTLVHRPGSVQSNILVGNLTFRPNDPRTYSAAVANQVLGGGASSRLFLILREAKSWTYGAYSRFARHKGVGSFEANTEVRTEVTDSALRETLAQLRRMADEPVPMRELEDAKGSLTGSFPLSIESADQVAGAVANARLYGLAPDYVQTYRVKIGAVTAAQVQATAGSTIRPGTVAIVVVGDGSKIYERLKDIAPISIVDPEGKPLTPADLTPRVAALDLDLTALV
ncbi:MAG TPA: pitrilysin family protein, partial [Gemmatimonadales bacterium]|nr:pitrilysin family protein [Gemmatimonadales bacterium]